MAYIDLVEGQTDDEIYEKTEAWLKEEGIKVDQEMFSTTRLSKNIVSSSGALLELEKLFKSKSFTTDPVNFNELCHKLKQHKVQLTVIGSKNDSITPVEAILEEQRIVNNLSDNDYYQFMLSEGNHREWKDNKELVSNILKTIPIFID